ncbi:MAG TPA: radical SAM protein [Gammaproteobacteria bacterium]|nr:radical SAM protein [Gammaproteobacteria bacterium]
MNRAAATIQSGRPSSRIEISPEAEQDVRQAFLATMRQRFKSEINRLTRGDMRAMLEAAGSPSPEAEALAFLLSYVYAWHWLQDNLHPAYRAEVLAAFSRGPQAFLMDLLLNSTGSREFIRSYIDHWQGHAGEAPLQGRQLLALLQDKRDAGALTDFIEARWKALGLFDHDLSVAYRDLARQERERYREMLGPEDRQRLALVDRLPGGKLPATFDKLGLIPAMGCPQTCRHCMFIFRPLVKNAGDPRQLFRMVDELTRSVLFTGGDLSGHLEHFYDAIGSMRHVSTFAILLNGDFADSANATREVMGKMAAAIRRRPPSWRKAQVMLQISFDEFHQEVVVDRNGRLKERIPITKIAHIIETAPKYRNEIQLCLVHKQGPLNFSNDLFHKGVFARLAKELGRRGHRIRVLSTAPSSRLKRNPQDPARPAALIKDASFVLERYPEAPVMLTSSTIDAYGRASAMGLHETVNERDLLQQMLAGKGTGGETFDKDLMLWFNGWATLFSAVHLCLGNVFEDGMEVIRRRQARDPLSNALHRFDLRLLAFYRERKGDLDEIIATSTSPHHLFHTITRAADMRLHMTRRLLEQS